MLESPTVHSQFSAKPFPRVLPKESPLTSPLSCQAFDRFFDPNRLQPIDEDNVELSIDANTKFTAKLPSRSSSVYSSRSIVERPLVSHFSWTTDDSLSTRSIRSTKLSPLRRIKIRTPKLKTSISSLREKSPKFNVSKMQNLLPKTPERLRSQPLLIEDESDVFNSPIERIFPPWPGPPVQSTNVLGASPLSNVEVPSKDDNLAACSTPEYAGDWSNRCLSALFKVSKEPEPTPSLSCGPSLLGQSHRSPDLNSSDSATASPISVSPLYRPRRVLFRDSSIVARKSPRATRKRRLSPAPMAIRQRSMSSASSSANSPFMSPSLQAHKQRQSTNDHKRSRFCSVVCCFGFRSSSDNGHDRRGRVSKFVDKIIGATTEDDAEKERNELILSLRDKANKLQSASADEWEVDNNGATNGGHNAGQAIELMRLGRNGRVSQEDEDGKVNELSSRLVGLGLTIRNDV